MNLSRWQQIGRRIARMDRAELSDRLRQEAASRQDALLARFGHDFGRNAVGLSGTTANFFFALDSVDFILDFMRQHLPQQVNRIVQQADHICQHRFDLLGYSGLEYGNPIDWRLDAVHKKRAPEKSSYRIRYLDYDEVGDSKVTWELNRHQHLVTLAKAYRLACERRYADEALRQWRHWRAENPYPMGINWASSLEAAFRSLSWIWTYYLLQGAPGIPNFRNEWLRGLAVHGRHIERHLSTYFSPNTHLLGEGVALFFIGVLCPELKAAARWKALGWKIVLQEAERQVRPDGFHFEQSTYYHVYALDFFLHSAVLASANGIAIPKNFEETVEKMLNALCLLARGGAVPRFGDDDGGRLFDQQRNRGEHLLDPLAAGAILFHRGDFKTAAIKLREETLWLLGAQGVRQWEELTQAAVSGESGALADAGFYMLPASGDVQLVVDAGPLGTHSGGHGHADALSVCLQGHGRSLLLDPGTYEYVGPGPERDLFRGTAMHNTLRVDKRDQAQPAGPFSWGRLTNTRVEQWVQGKSFDLLAASHDGYWDLESPVSHYRYVFSLRNGIYLIRDVVKGHGTHKLDLAWHLNPDLKREADGRFRLPDLPQRVAILPLQGYGWKEEVREESWSPCYGQKAPAPVLSHSAEISLPTEFAVLLMTSQEAEQSVGSFNRMPDYAGAEVHGYRYSEEAAEYSFVFGKAGEPWRKDFFSSDAEFVCLRKTSSGEAHLMLSGGSYVEVDGGAQLHCIRPVAWAELLVKAGERTVFSSDLPAVDEQSSGIQPTDAASPIFE
ncbi:MAG TPA: alginate lyase family protein [Candidatus Sulfotelmatobacter sp.]|nr:alginate lyase family protein [Candidatus Sulfotelmatobacter sp.]